ncbi:MAG: hypothetical protein ACJ76Z_14015 [Thermoleophilaceae bacterium]
MSRPRIACLLAAALIAGAGCGGHGQAPHPRKAAPPPTEAPAAGASDFIGVYSDDVFFGDDAYKRATLTRERRAGIGLIRQPFAWDQFAKSPAPFDAFVGAAARAGIHVLPEILGPRPGAPKATGGMAPPTDLSAYAAYATALVRRYGPDGSFWRAHPDIPRVPIRSWQIWNEPNIRAFWASGPDPAAYAQLLETASAAIRKADPNAEVVAAGLPTSRLGAAAADFLEGIYRAGAKGSFDTAAVHAYAPAPAEVVARTRALHDVIARNGDDARLWVTEFGWGTGGDPGPLTVDPQQQAGYIADTIRRLKADRDALRLRGLIVFQWRDPKPFPGRRALWPYYAGLLDADGNPKPSLAAFERAATLK